jgi:hypothetical protein
LFSVDGRWRKEARPLRIPLSPLGAQYHRGRGRFPAPTAACINAILLWRQKASRCAAKNDIQPAGLERNVLGCGALFSLRAYFSFWLGKRRVGSCMRGLVPANE